MWGVSSVEAVTMEWGFGPRRESGRQTVRVKAGQNAQSNNGGPDLEDSETKPLYSLFPLRKQGRTNNNDDDDNHHHHHHHHHHRLFFLKLH
ncbi:unnamed protein product [Citrullus colocynthis]|uniref:Uncharacterized protein n=1 Tax=Citrullus colocynthis TaxID=252529 RepID=A0ABP0YC22_9ROSI